jgi:hypothetical protein
MFFATGRACVTYNSCICRKGAADKTVIVCTDRATSAVTEVRDSNYDQQSCVLW